MINLHIFLKADTTQMKTNTQFADLKVYCN